MGIDGLLALLKPITHKTHISEFKGQTIGIDALPWLYKGCYSYIMQAPSEELGEAQHDCSQFLFDMIILLEKHEIKPIFVFDGRSLPMKKDTITKRQNARESNTKKGEEMICKNNQPEARKFIARGIRVDEKIIIQALSILQTKNLDFIISPYEADSQLAKLYNLGLINTVITEDSDLLVYGCNAIYKLDEEGMCDYIDLKSSKNDDEMSEYLKVFLNFDFETRISACVLAGCDYVKSIKGIGIKKSIKMVENESNIIKLIEKLQSEKLYYEKIPINYEISVLSAITIFKHALVFNPIQQCLEPLNRIQTELENADLIGYAYEEYIDKQLWNGRINCRSFEVRDLSKVEMKREEIVAEVTNLKELKSMLPVIDDDTNSILDENMFMAMF